MWSLPLSCTGSSVWAPYSDRPEGTVSLGGSQLSAVPSVTRAILCQRIQAKVLLLPMPKPELVTGPVRWVLAQWLSLRQSQDSWTEGGREGVSQREAEELLPKIRQRGCS